MSMAGRICGEASASKHVYRIRYADENISSLTNSPVPEILYYNRRGVFSDYVVLNIKTWMRISGELSLCEVRTHISTGRLFARLE